MVLKRRFVVHDIQITDAMEEMAAVVVVNI